MELKNIKIGNYLQDRVRELDIPIERICNFFNTDEKTILSMYEVNDISTETLRWSKLLDYDFFRMYTQHLILYAPASALNSKGTKDKSAVLPLFRKNIYTEEIIEFILELIETGKKTKIDIVEEYRIPKTTLYKWIKKYNKNSP